MKKIFLLVGCLFILNANAQSEIDTLKQKINYLEQQMIMQELEYNNFKTNVRHDLVSFKNQYTTGTLFKISGLTLTGVSFLIIENDPGTSLVFSIVGLLCFLAGEVVHIDSHKYLGGRFSLTVNPNGVSVRRQEQRDKRIIRGVRIE